VAMRNRSASWRKLAEEAKALAARMQDAASKQTILEIAERYEVLAAYAERQAKDAEEAPRIDADCHAISLPKMG
jgi:hypothetical protein